MAEQEVPIAAMKSPTLNPKAGGIMMSPRMDLK